MNKFSSIVLLSFFIISSMPVAASPYIVSSEIGKELVITSYDMELNKIAEYRENITIGPSYEKMIEDKNSIYDNPKLEFLADKPFNIRNQETIIFENINNNSISKLNIPQFLSGSNEVTKLTDISLDKITLEGRSKENLIFDGLVDTKLVWLDESKIRADVDGVTSSLSDFKKKINYTMEIFDVVSNLKTIIEINWTNFPANLIIDENDPTLYHYELRWKGSTIRDKYDYQIFYYLQFPQDDQSTASISSKIFVIRFDTESYTFNNFIFNFDESINPEKYSTIVYSTDGTKILLAPWIEGRTNTDASSSDTFLEDQVGLIIDTKLNTISSYPLFAKNDNSQFGIRYLALSDNNIIYVKNERELISYDLSEKTSNILVNDIRSKLDVEASLTFRNILGKNTGSIFLINDYFILMNANTIIDQRTEGTEGTEVFVSLQTVIIFLTITTLSIKRKINQTYFSCR